MLLIFCSLFSPAICLNKFEQLFFFGWPAPCSDLQDRYWEPNWNGWLCWPGPKGIGQQQVPGTSSRCHSRNSRLNAVLLKCIFDCISLGPFHFLPFYLFSLFFHYFFTYFFLYIFWLSLCSLRTFQKFMHTSLAFLRLLIFSYIYIFFCILYFFAFDSFTWLLFFCFISYLFGIFNKRRQKGSLFFSLSWFFYFLFLFVFFVQSAHKEKQLRHTK